MELLKPLRYISSLNRKKQDPGKFVFTGKTIVGITDIQLFAYNKETHTETRNVPLDDINKFVKNGFTHWLNIYGLNKTEAIAAICEKQGIHSLVIQDILDVNQRP